MSSSYYIFTEGFFEGKWMCLNTYLKKDDKYIMSETYYSGSRTYFSSTFDKLEEIGQQINKEDLSPELQNWIKDDRSGPVLGVSLYDIHKSMPRSQKYEYHGYVEKSTVFLFESNELEDIFEWLSPDEYIALNEETRKSYQYYEWNSTTGWYKHFVELIERIKWQQYDWSIVHSFSSPIEQIRLLALRDY